MAVTGRAPGVAGESILVSKAPAFDLDILENVELSRRDSRTFLLFHSFTHFELLRPDDGNLSFVCFQQKLNPIKSNSIDVRNQVRLQSCLQESNS